MAPVSSLFLMFLISLFNPYGAVSISIAISIFLDPNSKLKTQNFFLVGYSIALSRLKSKIVSPGHPHTCWIR